ncbi:ABC transporter substrate-binding protein [Vibrio sp. FJH11]
MRTQQNSVKKHVKTAAKVLSVLAMSSQLAHAGKLSIGMTTWVGYGTLYLADELGYFKEKGLEVDLQTIEQGSTYMAAAASGHLDGSASTIDAILKYRPKFCFKAVAALDDSFGGDGILVQNGINSIQDLKGKTVAVNEGSVSQFWLSNLLKQAGMTMSDINVQNMTADDAASVFISGGVQAAVTWEPNLTYARTNNVGKVLVDSTSTPGIIVDVVNLRCDVIENQPDDVAALVNGLYRAVEYTKENPEKAYAIMAKKLGGYLSDPKDLAGAAATVRFYDQEMNVKLLGENGKEGELAPVIKLANETWSQLQGEKFEVTFDDLVDNRFIKQ